MDFICCQKCFAWPQVSPTDIPKRYFLMSCGHLFCHACVPNDGDSAGPTCPMCKTAGKITEICSTSSVEVKTYFMDPVQLIQDSLKMPLKVLQFQENLRKQAMGIIGKTLENQKSMANQTDSLKDQIASLKETNASLKRQVKDLETKLAELQRSQKRRRYPFENENSFLPSPSLSVTPSRFNFSAAADPLNLFSEPSQMNQKPNSTPFKFAQPILPLPRKSFTPSPILFDKKAGSGIKAKAASPYPGTSTPLLALCSPHKSFSDSVPQSTRSIKQDTNSVLKSEEFIVPQERSPALSLSSPTLTQLSSSSNSSFVTASPTFPIRTPEGKIRVMSSPAESPILTRLRGLQCKPSPRR